MSLGGGDLQIILRRIRHGFIICDDTELCDKIISQDVENEQRRKALLQSKSIDMKKTDLLTLLRTEQDFILNELSHSPEWTATNVQVRRVRCETLGRLDEIKTENEAKRKVQIISWQDPARRQSLKMTNETNHLEDNDSEDSATSLFQRRLAPVLPTKQPSPLTALIQSKDQKQNPFAQYAKFDGIPTINTNQCKKFTVHFQSQRQKIPVVVASNATVEETIGFACFRYTSENREPLLTQNDPSKYSLCIADDDGQPEDDFPPLTNTRPIGQYDFPHLTLVEQRLPSVSFSTLSSNDDNHNNNNDDDDDGDDSLVDDSSRSATPPQSEKQKSTASLEKPVSAGATPDKESEPDPIDNMNRLLESLNQRSYRCDMIIKHGSSKHIKVRIDVSGEQIRIELLEKTSKLAWHNVSYVTQRLVDCVIVTKEITKKRDRACFNIVFETQQESDGARMYQTYEFESISEQAEQLREQILHIIRLKNPQGRDIYGQQTQRRDITKKRRSLLSSLIGGSSAGSSSKS